MESYSFGIIVDLFPIEKQIEVTSMMYHTV